MLRGKGFSVNARNISRPQPSDCEATNRSAIIKLRLPQEKENFSARLIIFFNCCAWIVAAYRPESGADVIQSWYDWSWFAFLLGWIYLAIEMVATGIVELMDHRTQPMIPRWLTWFTFFGALALLGAAGPAFFKSGPFAYHGLLAFYLPVIIWGAYLALTTFYMMKGFERAPDRTQSPTPASTAGTPGDRLS